jgi:cell wall-associated NlpC family hydrolase
MTSAILLTACAFGNAGASQSHILKQGETLDALARRYHVSAAAIAAANHLADVNDLREGRRLVIPDPPRHAAASLSFCRPARIKGDCISVRTGPGPGYRRLILLENGTPVTTTARRDVWAQVDLPGGQSGWVRADFLLPRNERATRQASATENRPRHHASARAAHAERNRARKGMGSHPAAASAQVVRRDSQEPDGAHEAPSSPPPHHRSPERQESRHGARREIAAAPAPEASSDIVRTAYSYRGTPYVYGGSSRGGFDCSGFTSYLYSRQGVALPHTARGQFAMGRKVDRSDLKPGDLVFFHTVTPGISHVGVYVGNGHFIHASSRRSGGVRVDSLDSGYYKDHFRGARRINQ